MLGGRRVYVTILVFLTLPEVPEGLEGSRRLKRLLKDLLPKIRSTN